MNRTAAALLFSLLMHKQGIEVPGADQLRLSAEQIERLTTLAEVEPEAAQSIRAILGGESAEDPTPLIESLGKLAYGTK